MQVQLSLRVATVVVVATAAVTVGCGSSSDTSGSNANGSSSTGSAGSSGGVVAAAKASLQKAEAKVTGGVPASSPPVIKNKFVVLVPCAQAGEGCAQPAEGAAEAAKALGWRAQIIDGKGTADGQSAAIQQAITLHPDVIVTFAIDPTSIKGAINATKKAGIPVIGSSAVQTPTLAFSDNPTTQNWEQTGKAVADYVIAKSNGKANVLLLTDNEFAAVNQRTTAAEKELGKCSSCKVVKKSNFNFADLASGLPQLVQQTLQANPSINAVYVPYDAAVPPVLQGLKAIGATGKIVVAGDGTTDGLKCIREGCGLAATGAFPLTWIGWADMDAANRIFNKTNPQVATAHLPVKLMVKDNVPSTSGPWDGDFDFKSAYKRIWKVG